jgi:predicted dehydrogenase
MTTIAMVGLTHPHSEMYLETLEALDEIGAIQLVDADQEAARASEARVAKSAGVFSDLEAALAAGGATHVLVAEPNDRAPLTLRRAIEAGRHVFTEKPAARNAAEFRPVLEALRRRPVAFSIAYQNRGSPAIVQLRDMYRGGAIGRLTSVELRMVTTQVHMRDPGHWLFKKEVAGSGILGWLGCHWLDAVRFVTGEEYETVSAQLATTSGEAITVEDTAAVTFRLSGGAIGSLHAGYLLAMGNPGYRGGAYDISFVVRGTLGWMSYHRGVHDFPVTLESVAPGWRGAGRRTFQFAPPPAPGYGGLAGQDFFRAFLAARPGEPGPVGAIDALRLLELLDAIYEADKTGRRVEVAHAASP